MAEPKAMVLMEVHMASTGLENKEVTVDHPTRIQASSTKVTTKLVAMIGSGVTTNISNQTMTLVVMIKDNTNAKLATRGCSGLFTVRGYTHCTIS